MKLRLPVCLKTVLIVLAMGSAFADVPKLTGSGAAPECPHWMNEYEAFIVSAFDGDTLRGDVEVGLDVEVKNQRLRLIGVAAPEKKGPTYAEAIISRDRLRELALARDVLICTDQDKKDKYGRYLVIVLLLDGTNVNKLMVDEGFAVYRE